MKDAVSVVKQYDYSGKMLREIQPPGRNSRWFWRKEKDKTLYYSFNYTTPGTIIFDPNVGKSAVYEKP
jgi:prolyl oligopeptidase